MLEELIETHQDKVSILACELINSIQPYVISFCESYDLSFSSGQGDWYFHFGNIHSRPDSCFLRQLDESLFLALEYEYHSHWELGSVLKHHKIELSAEQLVYLHCDHTTEKRWISENPTQLVNIAGYGLMSMKMAQQLVNNYEIDLREW